jgi:hypothetical protein
MVTLDCIWRARNKYMFENCVEGNHILRETNQAADTYSKEGLNQPMQLHIFVNVTFFYSAFVADNSGSLFVRGL